MTPVVQSAPSRDARHVHAHEKETSPSSAGVVTILARAPWQCSWIAGTGEDGLALCCGHRVMRPGTSWCEPHARIVIRPAAWEHFAGKARHHE